MCQAPPPAHPAPQEPRGHPALAWRSHAPFLPCLPTIPAPKGQGCEGWGGGRKEMGGGGAKKRKMGGVAGVCQMHDVRVPPPTPIRPGPGLLSVAAACPLAVHLIHVGHCPNGWQHKLGRPNICPQPDSPAGELTPDWPPERSALPTLLDSSCKDARGMACWRAPHPA